jgi:hypothetical protein
MFGFGWLTLRQVQEALNDGRLDEAQRLLEQKSVQGHKRHGELLRRLAHLLVERGERHLRLDDSEAAWQDLLRAEQLQTGDRGAERLRVALTRLGIAQVRGALQAGDPKRAGQIIAQLRDHFVRNAEVQLLEETTKSWLMAQEMAERGEFGPALGAIDRVQRQLLGPPIPLEQFRQALSEKQQDFNERLLRLHEAADGGRWREVVEIAEGILAVAPQHPEAKKARSQAWRAVEPATVVERPRVDLTPAPKSVLDDHPQRFFLWVDGVGGYLICLSPNVSLGQALPEAPVDVPLVADVSRMHATVTRDSEGGYVLEAPRPVQVNGQSVTRWVLQPGDRLTLGISCQLRFQKPVPVSVSARLDLVSGHRSLPGVDGVLLMADTLVLGPSEQSHVRIPDLKQPLILYRSKEGLGVRYAGNLLVDGARVKERAMLGPTAHVSGDEFSLAIEPASRQ